MIKTVAAKNNDDVLRDDGVQQRCLECHKAGTFNDRHRKVVPLADGPGYKAVLIGVCSGADCPKVELMVTSCAWSLPSDVRWHFQSYQLFYDFVHHRKSCLFPPFFQCPSLQFFQY